MEFELPDIGSTSRTVWGEQLVRGYRPLSEEARQCLTLAGLRSGYSPRLSSLKVTDECNFRCLHCNAYKYCGRQMTTEEIFNVEENLAQAGIQRNDITGGEPLLRKDLPSIIEHSYKLGMVTTLNTNGGREQDDMAKEELYWRQLADSGLFGAYFSYDGMGQKTDPRVIHLAHFLGETLHIVGGIRTVVTQENLDKLYAIGKTVMLNSIFFQAVPAVALGGESSALPGDFKPLDYAGRQEFIKIIRKLSKVRGPFANFLHVPRKYLKEVVDSPDPDSAWHCKNPSAHWIFVDAQGNARVCDDRPLPEVYSLIGQENPLLTKEFRVAVTRESEKCGGCSWFCHWEGNRKQVKRGLSDIRFFATIGSLT